MTPTLRNIRPALYALLLSLAFATSARNPKFEFRGAWVATVYGIDWPSAAGTDPATVSRQKAELSRLIRGLADAGFNAVLFQVRPMADALYASSIEPSSAYLTGRRGATAPFDPLAYCIAECHARGLECHAWINPFRVGSRIPATEADRRNSHLWITNTVGSQTMTIFNPAMPETRRHLCRVVTEIAQAYDIDGIIFDDYFYNPEFLPEDNRAADWDSFLAATQGLTMAQWRRANINKAIAEVYDCLSTIKSGSIRFGVSPQGIAGGNGAYNHLNIPSPVTYGVVTADSQYDKIYSDPVDWIVNGVVDYISPQIYWATDNPRHPYGALSRWWCDLAEQFSRHCFPSITIASLSKANTSDRWQEAERQIDINREASFNGAPGSVFYSASYISGPKTTGLGARLADDRFATKALVPPMTWKHASQPAKLTGLSRSGNQLSWHADPALRYVIYAIPSSVDIIDALSPDDDGFDAAYIIGVTYSDRFTLPDSVTSSHHIAVAPYDRFGNEWQPSMLPDHAN